MTTRHCSLSAAALMVLVGFLTGLTGCGTEQPFAVTKKPSGKVDVRQKTAGTFVSAEDGTSIQRGGALRVGEKSTTGLHFTDGSEMQVRAESYIELDEGNNLVKQDSGAVLYNVKPQKDTLRIQTPHGVTAVLGTTFLVEVSSQSTSVALKEGKIAFTSQASGEVRELTPGHRLVAPAVGTLPQTLPMSPMESMDMFSPGEGVSININRR
ncbi:MAG: FecR family protein [Candidatus Ozemobacteraceae bacterium]